MSSQGYKLLGWAVWNGAKWYLRRRLPSARRVATGVVVVAVALAAAGVLARRLAR